MRLSKVNFASHFFREVLMGLVGAINVLLLKQGNQVVSIVARDANGNATTKKYTISVGGVARTLEHDLNGNLVRESIGTTRVPKYEWDSLNRLIAIQSDKVPVAGSWRTEFADDGQSRRVLIGPELDQTAQEKDERKWQWFMGGEGIELCGIRVRNYAASRWTLSSSLWPTRFMPSASSALGTPPLRKRWAGDLNCSKKRAYGCAWAFAISFPRPVPPT